MTIFSSVFRTDWLAADGVNKDWSYAFSLQEDDVVVEVRDADGVITTFTSNYEFFPTDESEGFVRYPSVGDALDVGNSVRISRDIPYTQPTAIGSQGRFHPEIHEGALDRATIQIQQLKDFADRSPKVPAGDTAGLWDVGAEDELVAFGADGGGKPAGHSIADLQAIETAAAESAADAAQAASDAAASAASANAANTKFLASRADILTTNVPASIEFIQTAGYAEPGDGGGALYYAVGSEPAHAGKAQSQDGGWWHLAPESIPNVRAWGALPGLGNDATAGIQALLDYYAQETATDAETSKGSTLYLGDGLYRITQALVVKSRNVVFRANGKRNMQGDDGTALRSESGSGTIYSDHDGSAILVDTQYPVNGFQFREASLVPAANRPVGSKGIHFLVSSASFRRDFVIEDASISRFENATYTERTTGDSAIGVLRMHRNNIMFNGAIHNQDTDVQWNGFSFCDNDAGQNITKGVFVQAQAVRIVGNVLEGQPDPITVQGAYRAFVIQANYFEANTGTACIQASSVRHGVLGPNFYHVVTTDYKALVSNARGVRIQDPAFVFVSTLCDLPTYRALSGGEDQITAPAASLSWGHVARAPAEMIVPKGTLVNSSNSMDAREEWVDGRIIGVREMVTSGTGLTTITYSITANIGDIIVASIPLKYLDAPSTARFGMYVNSSSDTAKGSSAPQYEAAAFPVDEWIVATLAVKAREAVTSFQVLIYPFNISPAVGLVCRYLRPTLHVVTDPSDIAPYVDIEKARRNTAPPTAGTWVRGDIIYDSTPAVSGFIGWACTTAGTPGTWTPFGETISQQTLNTNANFTLTPSTSPIHTLHTGTLTAARTVTLSTTEAYAGQRFRITRTGLGAFPLNVGTGPLVALYTGEWAEVVYDGSAWVLAAYSRLATAEGVNVSAFGAKPDGTTDATSAIQTALTYAASLGHSTVILPYGRFLISGSGITVPAGVSMRGQGMANTRIIYDGTGTAITWEGTKDLATSEILPHVGSRLSDFSLWQKTGTKVGIGIWWKHATRSHLIRVGVKNFERGVDLSGACWSSSIDQCWIVLNEFGIWVGATDTNYNKAEDVSFTTLENSGFNGGLIQRNEIQGNDVGIYMPAFLPQITASQWVAHGLMIFKNIIEGNQKNGIVWSQHQGGLVVAENYFELNCQSATVDPSVAALALTDDVTEYKAVICQDLPTTNRTMKAPTFRGNHFASHAADVWAFYHDRSQNEVDIKYYDNHGNVKGFCVVQRHTDFSAYGFLAIGNAFNESFINSSQAQYITAIGNSPTTFDDSIVLNDQFGISRSLRLRGTTVGSPFTSFTNGDTTPSVSARSNFKTANTAPTTITTFDDGVDGQEIFVQFADANTTVDFGNATLRGNGGVDYIAQNGDTMRAVYNGTFWYCDVTRSANNSGPQGTATVDPASLATGASTAPANITVTGAALGDIVRASFSLSLAGVSLHAYVSAANTVSYFFRNDAGANPTDLGSGTVKVRVEK